MNHDRRKGQPLSTDHALAVLGGLLGGVLTALAARALDHRHIRRTVA